MPQDDVLPEDIPYPEEVLPRGRIDFGGAEPLPLGTMNETFSTLPRSYATAEDNAYVAEHRAMEPAYLQRQRALLKADAEERAIRTAGQLEYQQLVQGGALPEEAYRRVAGKLNWNHPDKLALALDRLSLPSAIPGSVNATPIMGAGGLRIGDAVYDAAGRLHSTRFSDPNKLTPEEIDQKKIDKEIRDSLQARLQALYRSQASGSMGSIVNTNQPNEIKDLEAQLAAMRQQARGGSQPIVRPANEEKIVVVKDGKRYRLPKSQLAEAEKEGYKQE